MTVGVPDQAAGMQRQARGRREGGDSKTGDAASTDDSGRGAVWWTGKLGSREGLLTGEERGEGEWRYYLQQQQQLSMHWRRRMGCEGRETRARRRAIVVPGEGGSDASGADNMEGS